MVMIIENLTYLINESWIVKFLLDYGSAYILLIILMVMDVFSERMALRKEEFVNPYSLVNEQKRKAIAIALYRKLGYLLINIVALSLDYVLHRFSAELGIELMKTTGITIAVLVWSILSELISITKHATRLGGAIPRFLVSIIKDIKKEIESWI